MEDRTRDRTKWTLWLFVLAALAGGCRNEEAAAPAVITAEPPPAVAPAANDEASAAEGQPYGREPFPGIITAGQPSREDFETARHRGVETVINLRTAGEPGTEGEAEAVEALGMTYLSMPIRGADDLTEGNARALAAALDGAEIPVMVHCGSSDRVGALFALRAFYVDGKSGEEALEIGLSAGLTRLEPRVREILDLKASP